MPQVQFVDQPSWGSALGEFGSGVLGEYTKKLEQGREEDAMQQALSKAKEIRESGGSDEDVMASLLSQKGLSFERKKGLADVFKDVGKRKADIEFKKGQVERDEERLQISRDKAGLDLKKLDQREKLEYKKDMLPLNNAINSVERMKKIRGKGNLGKPAYLTQLVSGETRKDMLAYSTAAKSLIAMIMSGVPIRNKHEFLAAADQLTDPYLTDAAAEGIISELERRLYEEMDFLNSHYTGQEGRDSQPLPGNQPTLEEVQAAIKRKRGG